MKSIIVFLAAASILFASCSSVDSKIVARGVDNQGHWEVFTSGSAPVLVYDSLYKVSPNFSQKYALAQHLGTVWPLYVLCILGLVLIAAGTILMYRSSGSVAYVILIFLGILIAAGGFGSIGWSDSKEADIPKTTYDSLMKADGNLQEWWITEGNLYK